MMNNLEKVFRYFGLNMNESRTIRQLSLETGISYMTLNRLIKKLEKQDLIITEKVGKSVVCSLNRDNEITKQHLILASQSFKNSFLEKKPLLKKISKAIMENKSLEFTAVLFGSYASGKEQKHSDVDIAFISTSQRITKSLQDDLRTIEQIHDIKIYYMVFTERQFKAMLKTREENVGKQILRNHIILQNPELFWNFVYEVA